MLVSKMGVITLEKHEKNKKASESTHSVIRPVYRATSLILST